MCWSPVGRIRVGASKSEQMKEPPSRVADLPVHFAKETWLFLFPSLTNGDSSVNQDISINRLSSPCGAVQGVGRQLQMSERCPGATGVTAACDHVT